MKTVVEIEGMTCSGCAATIKKSLQNDGLLDVDVDYLSGEATFRQETGGSLADAFRHIASLGYRVREVNPLPSPRLRRDEGLPLQGGEISGGMESTALPPSPLERNFYICLAFTVPVVLHMFVSWPLLHHPVFQLVLSLPVMLIGWYHFGRSAWMSLRLKAPNMDVLIALGSSAAFAYSLAGMLLHPTRVHDFLFFETADSIVTLVLLGNLLELRSVRHTTSALRELKSLQPEQARLIQEDGGREKVSMVASSSLVPGDNCLVNAGEKIPADGLVTWGEADVDESMMTGESLPIEKVVDSAITGGTTVLRGSVKMKVEKTGSDSYLEQTIRLVKDARMSRPAIQKTGDRISAVFVPVVVALALLTYLVSHLVIQLPASQSLLHSIAVLVISCPCAMGLATPTAVMVGLGRAARQGILVKGGATLEQLAQVRTVVFDKTGTLTTGKFRLKALHPVAGSAESARLLLYSLERHSSHPIAQSLVRELAGLDAHALQWKSVQEDKGVGIHAWDHDGNLYSAGSFQVVRHLYPGGDARHNIYILKNNQLVATADIADELKPGAAGAILALKKMGIRPVLVSGDRQATCEEVAAQCGISEVHAEQMPAQKLKIIEDLSNASPTAMVGDGINDAPALARASVGISLSEATQVAIQSAQVILVPGDNLEQLVKAISISRLTLSTIRQNLFWALAYNVVAIPIAAVGLLSPMVAAFSMAFSDIVVIGNSLRLRTKKIF